MKRFPSAIIELIFTAAACNFMKKKYQIITTSILLLFFSLLLINVALAQERPLEAEYPEIQGFKPETVATNLPQYVKYIFNFAIAIRTYFQKVADPKDIAPSMAVGFTINHIAAVFLPAVGGFLWMVDYRIPFVAGAFFSLISLLAVQKIRV